MLKTILIALMLLLTPATSRADDITDAEDFFMKYMELHEKFDPAILDLYAKDAFIKNTLRSETGRIRSTQIPTAEYFELFKAQLEMDKANGEYISYNDLDVIEENVGLRVKAMRNSELKGTKSQMSLLLVRRDDGSFIIVEETFETPDIDPE